MRPCTRSTLGILAAAHFLGCTEGDDSSPAGSAGLGRDPSIKGQQCVEQTDPRGLLALPSPRPGQGQKCSRIALT
jgi:hypothetical protein